MRAAALISRGDLLSPDRVRDDRRFAMLGLHLLRRQPALLQQPDGALWHPIEPPVASIGWSISSLRVHPHAAILLSGCAVRAYTAITADCLQPACAIQAAKKILDRGLTLSDIDAATQRELSGIVRLPLEGLEPAFTRRGIVRDQGGVSAAPRTGKALRIRECGD